MSRFRISSASVTSIYGLCKYFLGRNWMEYDEFSLFTLLSATLRIIGYGFDTVDCNACKKRLFEIEDGIGLIAAATTPCAKSDGCGDRRHISTVYRPVVVKETTHRETARFFLIGFNENYINLLDPGVSNVTHQSVCEDLGFSEFIPSFLLSQKILQG